MRSRVANTERNSVNSRFQDLNQESLKLDIRSSVYEPKGFACGR
jgi:hypothetical protein